VSDSRRPAATVLIPSYERGSMLQRTLPFLARQTLPHEAYEILVVDDGSQRDHAALAVESLALPNVVVLSESHRGSARARNAGLAVARGEVIVFVDDDAFVGPHYLEEHLRIHQRDPNAVVAGGIVQVRAIPDAIDEAPGFAAYHRHPFPGGNASVRAEHLRRVGGFDDGFETYGWHDQELGERLLQSGLRRRFAWRAPIHHYKTPGYDIDLRMQLARERDRGRMGARFYWKHPRWSVGVTTKLHPVVQQIERMADSLFSIEALQRDVEMGAIQGERVAPWKRALLRAHAEIAAGRAELRALRGGQSSEAVRDGEPLAQSRALVPVITADAGDADDAPDIVLAEIPARLSSEASTARQTSPNVG
jgi:hypothetical protein